MKQGYEKYRGFEPINIPDRTWPNKTITKAPTWCSVDLRDGNQALVDPMNLQEKLEFFTTLVKVGFKEIEVGFPSASETEYEILRTLIEGNYIPDDVTIQVLVQAREHLIRKTFEAIDGAKNVIVHFYNSTSTLQRKVVFKTDMQGVIDIAIDGAKLIYELTEEEKKKNPDMNIRFEYNRSVQGFLVGGVERIVNLDWSKVLPPPQGMGKVNYLTAVTEVDGELVEILDVEKILDEISPIVTTVSEKIEEEVKSDIENKAKEAQAQEGAPAPVRKVMVADDSSVARKQVSRALASIGLEAVLAQNGLEAFNMLKEMSAQGPIGEQIGLLISDIEMPEMDGYTLTAKIRQDPDLKDMKIVLHTSLSGVFNQAMVKKVGADNFIAKFNPDELAKAVKELMKK